MATTFVIDGSYAEYLVTIKKKDDPGSRRDYKLVYRYGGATGRAVLHSFNECTKTGQEPVAASELVERPELQFIVDRFRSRTETTMATQEVG